MINEDHELFRIAAHLTAQALWAAAPRLKAPAFADENEWRLITSELDGDGTANEPGDVPLETRFRASRGRIIPYKGLAFDPLAVTQIIPGSAVPMEPDDPGLTLLVPQFSGRVTRSDVPVRP